MKKSPKKTTKKRMTLEDLARMVANSLAEFRAEFNGRMDKMEHKLDTHITQTAEGFQDMRNRFTHVDDRFDDVDKRFDVSEAGTHRRLTIVENTLKTLAKK